MTRLNLDEKFKQSKNTFVPGEVASHPETVGPTDAEKLEEVKVHYAFTFIIQRSDFR